MAYDYVRRAYGVAPEVGSRVRFTECGGDRFGIISAENTGCSHYVMVRFDGETEAMPCHPTSLDYTPDDRHRLPMWSVYDRPRDYPDQVVARRWLALPEPVFTHELRKAATLEELQEGFAREGLSKLDRMPLDDPKIVEVWL